MKQRVSPFFVGWPFRRGKQDKPKKRKRLFGAKRAEGNPKKHPSKKGFFSWLTAEKRRPPKALKPEGSVALVSESLAPVAAVSLPSEVLAKISQAPFAPALLSQKGLLIQDLLNPSPLLQQAMEGFLMNLRSLHTRSAYQKDLKRFFSYLWQQQASPELAGGPATRLNRSALIQYKEFLITSNLEHTTIDRHLATLKSFFQWLVGEGFLDQNPTEGVRFLKLKKVSPTRGFSDEEVCRILAMPSPHSRSGAMHQALLSVLFFCGLRRSEACSLQMKHLRFEKGQPYLCVQGKGNRERLLVVPPQVWQSLTHYFQIARRSLQEEDSFLFQSERLFQGKRRGGENGLNPSTIFYLVRRYARCAGIHERVSPHSCRATAISNARDHQVPDRAIQEFAGWSTPQMITRYDKRKDALEKAAGFSISYGQSVQPSLLRRASEASLNQAKELPPKDTSPQPDD